MPILFLILKRIVLEIIIVIAEVVFSEDCFSEYGNIGVNHLALLLLSEYTAGSIAFLGLSSRFLANNALLLHDFFLNNLVQRLDF